VVHGGGQEREVRSGTLDAAGVAAFGVAVHHAVEAQAAHAARLVALRQDLIDGIMRLAPDAIVNGDPVERLPATVRSRCRLLRLQGPSRQEARAWVGAQKVSQPELALAQVGQAPLAAAQLTAAYWSARDRLLPGLAVPRGGRREVRLLDMADAVELPHLVHLLQTWCLDLLAARHAIEPRYHPDQAEELRRCAPRAGPEALFALLRQLGHSRRLLEHPLNPRLAAEELLLGYMAMLDRG
jgi:hypothetical protein